MNKKLLKLCGFVFVFGLFCLMYGVSANAYIDPSVVTYTIQVGAGIVIAIGAVISIYYRKAKKKISNKLGIDENRNKEVESDDIFEEENVEEEKEVKEEKKVKKEKEVKEEKIKSNKNVSSKNKTNKNSKKNTNSKK